MAIAGPSYECLYAGVGTNGRDNDGCVRNKCRFSKALEKHLSFHEVLRKRFIENDNVYN